MCIYIEDAREFPRYHDDPANSRLFMLAKFTTLFENIFARVIRLRWMHERDDDNRRKFQIRSDRRRKEQRFYR